MAGPWVEPAIIVSSIAFYEAGDRGLQRRCNTLQMLDVDLDTILDARNFRACEAACYRQIIDTVANSEAGLLNASSDVEYIGNWNVRLF
jgi:hypothetical protein